MAFTPVPERVEVTTVRVPRRYRSGRHMRRALVLFLLAILVDAAVVAYLITATRHMTGDEDQVLGIATSVLPVASIAYFILGFLWYLATARASYRAWVQAELRDRIGEPEFINTFCGPGIGSAIALDTRRRVLHVVGGKQFARVPLSAIRNWS